MGRLHGAAPFAFPGRTLLAFFPPVHPARPLIAQAMAETPTHDEATDFPRGTPVPGEGPEEVFRCTRCGQEYEGADACPACGVLHGEAECQAHPGTAARGRCVICGRPLCEHDRDAETNPYLCGDHLNVRIIEGWAQVYSTTGEFEALLLRDNLQAEGIEAQVFSQKSHIYPVELGELSIVRLMVPVWQYAPALEVIREHMDTDGEVVFACPSCGEAYDPGDAECAECGAPLA